MERTDRKYGAKTLNSLYFGIGVSIILALCVALVGPMLVDWTAYRAAFEAEAAQILGHPVTVRGTADARILPYPSLRFSDVTIGEDAAEPLMTVGEFDVEIELFPLLSGVINVTAMHMIRPELNVRIADDGTFEWIPAERGVAIDPGRVHLAQVDIVDGSIHLSDARHEAPITVDGINLTLDARSLVGPYKAEGSVAVAGVPYEIKAATGSDDGTGRVPFKANVSSPLYPAVLNLDGTLEARERRPAWKGKMALARVIAKDERGSRPWSLSGDVELTSRQLLARSLALSYGSADRPFTLTGAATLDLQDAPRFEAVLSARQIDLDRTLGNGPDAPVDLSGALSALAGSIAALPLPPIDGRVGFDVPGIVVGGNIVSNLRLDVATAAHGWTIDTLEAELPGRSQLTARGQVGARAPVGFEGDVTLASDQPSTLIGWWLPGRPKSLVDGFDARAHLVASEDGFSLSGLEARLRDGRVSGEADYAPARGRIAPRLKLALAADQLRLDDVEAVAGLFATDGGAGGGPDVVLKAAVGTLLAGDARAEGLDVSASLVSSVLDVDRFYVRSLAGARVSAAGTISDLSTKPDGSIQLRMSAEKMDGVADLMRALFPASPAADALKRAAPALSPVNFEATVAARAAGEGTSLDVEVKGKAAATDVAGRLVFDGRVDRWEGGRTALELTLAGPDGAALMRQFGLDVGPGGPEGAGRVTVSAKGRPGSGLALAAKAEMGPTDLSLDGSLTLSPGARAKADVDVAVKSPDVGGLLALTGGVMQGVIASTPVDLAAHLSLRDGRLAATGLKGMVDGEPTSGELELDRAGEVPRLSGRLAMRSTSLAALGGMVLGPGVLDFPIVESRNRWPEAPFGPALIDGFDCDIAFAFDEVAIGEGLAAHKARFSLRSSPSGTGFDDISATFAGGTAGGSLVIKRDLDGTAGISGALSLRGAAADELAWRRDGRPVVTGSLSTDLQLSATGRTISGWVASLTGGGSFSLEDGAIRFLNPRAFSPVIGLADAGKTLPEERIRAVFTDNVDVGDLAFKRIDATFTLAAGTLRAPNIIVSGTHGQTSGSATIDLSHASLSSEWRLEASAEDVSASGGAVPQVAIVFGGPMDRPTRRIDVTAFASYLGIRALEQETKRVLMMQADILERELLARVVLRGREALARRDRLAAEAKARAAATDAAARAAATARALPRPAPGRGEGKAGSADDFAASILEQLKASQPKPPGTKLAPLPGIEIGLPPGGVPASAP